MKNKLPQIHLVYNRYKKASSNKPASVEIRITHNYKQKYISTGIKLYPNQWKNGKIINCENIIEISKTLNKMVSDVRSIVFDMVQNNHIDITVISDRLKAMQVKQTEFIEFCIQRAAIRKYGKGEDTKERYDRFIKRFSMWGKIKTFNDVTDSSIIDYDNYLTLQGMKPYSKWQNYHRFLNSFIMDAIQEGLITKNPYKHIIINKESSSLGIERCLTPEEFKKLLNTSMPTESLERVKDLFIFQVYTCLSYSDLRTFNPKYITTIRGAQVYTGKRAKTQKPFTIPLLEPAINILSKYNNTLPIISNVKYNAYLKKIAKYSDINKPISSHWARHTGATLLLNKGVDMRIVARICGHSSVRVTEQIYAKLLDETVVQAITNVFKQ